MGSPVIVPVMTLGNCVFFPQQLLPLRIFEPRYRKMLQEVLAGDRLFAVSQLDEEQVNAHNPEPPCPITCIGRIQSHVENADGTSHLILEGLRRARVVRVERTTPFPRLEIKPAIEEALAEPMSATREIARILSLSEKMLSPFGEDAVLLLQRLQSLANQPGALADAVAASFVERVALRRQLLECLSPEKRLGLVAEELTQIYAMSRIEGQNGLDGKIGLN